VRVVIAHIRRCTKSSSQDQPATQDGLDDLNDLIDGT